MSLLESLAVVMANLAAREPLVVVLDDVHWADASSWDALRYLADSVADSPVLVLALARPAELGEQQVAAEVLLGLEQDDVLARFPLRLLDRQGIADLAEAVLGRSPPEPLVDWLTKRALGNSLFALGLLRALLAEGADLNAPTLLSLPESLAERVLARVKLLDDPVRDTLEVLALLGCRVDLGGLLGVTGLPLDALGPVIDTLVRDRLVVEEERGSEVAYEIAHPLIAEMIVQGISAARRRVLHSRVGRPPSPPAASVKPPPTSPARGRSATRRQSMPCGMPSARRRSAGPTGRPSRSSRPSSNCFPPATGAGYRWPTPWRGRRSGWSTTAPTSTPC